MPETPPAIGLSPLPTWFGIGGGADRFCRPASIDELRHCLDIDPALRVLGEGANLLVDDDGVPELVVSLDSPAFSAAAVTPHQPRAFAGAGADLPRLILDCARAGLAGLEGLGGIPASVGGAVIMNAGGAFGQIADAVARIHALDRRARDVVLDRSQIGFAYRESGLNKLIVTGVEFHLTPSDPAELRARLKDVMAYKKASQPMAEKSAGCVFKNPTLTRPFSGTHPATHEPLDVPAGARISAGLLIELAGCKGLRRGGASVSTRHANFIVTENDARARHVIDLMREVARRVHDSFGIALQREVVVWSRHPEP